MTEMNYSGKVYKDHRFSNYREIVNVSADNYREKAAFKLKSKEGYKLVSYIEVKQRYYAICQAFIDAGYKGRRIAISGKNSFEWAMSYLAAATVGTVVPIDKELSGKDIAEFAKTADCAAILADSKILDAVKAQELECDHYEFKSIWDFGTETRPEMVEEIDTIEFPADECQILIFTSGTTGNSKGVCLSQANICANIYSTVSIVKITEQDTTLSLLPMHHTYECTLDFLLVFSKGCCITYCDGLSKVKKNLLEYQPTILVVVPAVLNMLCKQIKKSVAAECPKRYKHLFQNYSFSYAMSKVPFFIRMIIKKKVRANLGGKMRMFIVGAAATDATLIEDFDVLGIKTLQGYGLTECAPLLAGNCDFAMNVYSTGKPVPGVTLKIDEPNAEGIGEILAKGDNIMLGYFQDDEANAKTFKDGWFRTGDLGCFDKDGWLYIKGRLKNVIVTSNGKNIYPEELETRLCDYPEIAEALVLGSEDESGETSVRVKIIPNFELLKEKMGELPSMEEAKAHIQKVVEEINDNMPGYKRIKSVEVLKELEKTTTAKIKRFGKNMK